MKLPEEQRKQIEQEAEKLYPIDDPRKNMLHDNLGQYSRRDAYILGATTRATLCHQKDEEIKRLRQGLENIRRCCSSCGNDPVFRDSVIKDIDSIAEETLNL